MKRRNFIFDVGVLVAGGMALPSSLSSFRKKDIDFDYKQITIRSARGEKDKKTMLPEKLIKPLNDHL